MSLALCSKCQRFARPHLACPFCGTSIGASRPRARARGTRSALVAATAAILACGGTISGDGGADDAAIDGPRDASVDQRSDVDSGIIFLPDASDAREEDVMLPPPPYGSPPVPDE